MKWLSGLCAVMLLLGAGGEACADELFMVRSVQSFPEAMTALQGAIVAHGYKVARVQRVDIGLTGSGFETDKYRIVFFADPAEVQDLTQRYPHLIPYLPWPVTIFAEGDETVLVTANPAELAALATDPALEPVFARWSRDIRAILEDVRSAD